MEQRWILDVHAVMHLESENDCLPLYISVQI